MKCTRPLKGYRSATINPSGKRSLLFSPRGALTDIPPINLPCGRCLGCRISKANDWQERCVREKKAFDRSCFITLTYADAWLPPYGSLDKSDFQKFMKRLRKLYSARIRYFMCGEYGEKNNRPHYHAILFGIDFDDKKPWRMMENGEPGFQSSQLNQLWGMGICDIGEATEQSCGYVARYICSKLTGEQHEEKHGSKTQAYNSASIRPPIGAAWSQRYSTDLYPSDTLITSDGRRRKPTKLDDHLHALYKPEEMRHIKRQRLKAAARHAEDDTYERLAIKEECLKLRLKSLERHI